MDAGDIVAGAIITLIIAGTVGGTIAIVHFATTSDYGVSAQAGLKAGWAGEAAGEAAGGYERAVRAASMYERTGDGWTAAVAHGMAAKAAGNAAGEWTEVVEWIDKEVDRSGAAVPVQHRQIAAAAAAGWLSVEAASWERASEAAADAGRWTEAAVWSDNAARALAMSEALSIDAGTAKERRYVAEAIDGMVGE